MTTSETRGDAPIHAGDELLGLVGVAESYGTGAKRFVAVRDVRLRIEAGEFVCLLGPSGCGKSTLLRVIAGLNVATSGTVSYRGKPLDGVNPHTTIVFQTFALYPWLSVQDNVEIALKARGVPARERSARAVKLIDTVGLDGFESAYPRELSGGMRQKVGFARAMAIEPELLCLDEPFSALDVLSAEALRGELMELWLSKSIPTKAILTVTHNIEEAVLMADRIVVTGKDPGHIVTEIAATLRHPRARKDTAFQAVVDHVYAAVAGKTLAEAEIAAGHPTKRLPSAHSTRWPDWSRSSRRKGGEPICRAWPRILSSSSTICCPSSKPASWSASSPSKTATSSSRRSGRRTPRRAFSRARS